MNIKTITQEGAGVECHFLKPSQELGKILVTELKFGMAIDFMKNNMETTTTIENLRCFYTVPYYPQ